MLKEKKSVDRKVVIVTIIILLTSALTYWLVARPYFVTKNCQTIALENSGYEKDSWRSWAGSQGNQSNYMFVYEMCMQKEGINP